MDTVFKFESCMFVNGGIIALQSMKDGQSLGQCIDHVDKLPFNKNKAD